MKRTLVLAFILITLVFDSFSQSQIAIPFQAVARNTAGSPISNHAISVRISILDSIPTGPVIYAEVHNATTNELGLFTLSIGKGTIVSTTGPFDPTKWNVLSTFIKIEMDENGGSAFTDMGTTQILSVPFAAYAQTSGAGSVSYKGTWDADNNSPNLSSSIGNKGDYYVVSNASSDPLQNTSLNGIDDWGTGDWAIFNGTQWSKVDNSVTKEQIGLGNVDNVADADKPVSIPQAAALNTKANKVSGAVAGDIPTADQFGDLIDSGKKLSDYLEKTNTDPYTPTADFHPATKKYVDDQVGSYVPNGTAFGQMLHWNGSAWEADSGIYSNGQRMGIGITTEDIPLAIKTRVELKAKFISFTPHDDSQHWIINLNPTPLDRPGFSIDDSFATGLQSRLFLQKTTGFVGLGTVEPNEKLEVSDSVPDETTGIRIRNTASLSNNGWFLGHIHSSSSTTDNGKFVFSEPIGFSPGHGVSRMVIRSGGNVGINESNPDVTLHVTRPTTDPLSDVNLIENTGIIIAGPISSDHMVLDSRQIQARHGDYTPGGLSLSHSTLGLQPLGGGLKIHNSLPSENRITITPEGSIGIGIDTPDAPLGIITRSILKSKFINCTSHDGSQDWSINLNPSSLGNMGFSIEDNHASGIKSRLFLEENTGNVGLGTTEPLEKLHIEGAIIVGNSVSVVPPDGTVRWSGADLEGRKNGSWVSLTSGGSSLWNEGGVGASGEIYYNPVGVQAKVGIGLSTPGAALHVREINPVFDESVAVLINNEASSVSPIGTDNRIGLQIATSGTWSPNPTAKNIGLYVSNVTGQSSSNQNIAAVLNGNTVIGDVVAGQSSVGTNGEKVLVIQNGAPPISTLGSATNVGIQIYSDEIISGTSVIHVMNGDGTVLKFYSEAALTASSALSVAGAYDLNEMTVINNLRTRLDELEARLQAMGLLH